MAEQIDSENFPEIPSQSPDIVITSETFDDGNTGTPEIEPEDGPNHLDIEQCRSPVQRALLTPEVQSIQESINQQRRASVQLNEEIQKMEQLKAERERETQEVKKRQALPNYNSLLYKKCSELLKESKELESIGETDECLQKLTKLIMMQPTQWDPELLDQTSKQSSNQQIAEPYRMRAEIYLNLCDFQSSILNYKKVCSLLPDEPEHFERLAFVFFFYGQVLFDQGQFPEALECFSRAAEMRPDTVGYHTRSIACLASLQRHGECLALVNRRIEAESDNPDLFVMRARLHQLFGNSTLCYYDVRDALELDPDLDQAQELREMLFEKAIQLKNQAIVFLLENKLEKALSKMSQAIDHDPTVAELHVLRGAIYRRLRKFNQAVDDFLLSLDKTNHDEKSEVYQSSIRQLILSYNDFAIECFTKRYYEEAVSLLNKAIRAEKCEKGLYINRGDCFFQMLNYHFALADYQQALELDKDDWDVKSRISLIFNEFAIMDYFERRYLESEKKFTFAIQHNPKVSQFYISRARVRHLLDFHKGAREDVVCALHLSPNNEEILSLIARLFPGKGVADIKNSQLYVSTVKKLNQAFQLSAPKRPLLRPLSAMSTTTELAEKLSNEITILPSNTNSRQGQRLITATSSQSVHGLKSLTSSSRGHRDSKRGKGSGHSKQSASSAQTQNEKRVKKNSGRNVTPSNKENQNRDEESVSDEIVGEMSSKEFLQQRKQLNDDVRQMLNNAHSLTSLPKRNKVLVNPEPKPKKSVDSKSSRWGSASNKDT